VLKDAAAGCLNYPIISSQGTHKVSEH